MVSIEKIYDPLVYERSVKDCIREFYNELDSKKVDPSSCFKNKEEKDLFESKVNNSLNKFENVLYHFQKVLKLNNEVSNIDFEEETYFVIDNRFRIELEAFLTAIRSCLDFLSIASNTFLKIEKKKKDHEISVMNILHNPKDPNDKIYIIFDKFKDWINDISNYRNKTVHALTFNTSVFKENMIIFGLNVNIINPTIIPRSITNDLLNTRKNWDKIQNKFKKILKKDSNSYEFGSEISNDYIAIEDFMENNYEKLTDIFLQVVHQLIYTFKNL